MALLDEAVAYWRAASYSGAGDWLDLSGNGHTGQLGSVSGPDNDTNDPLFLEPDGGVGGTQHLWLPGSAGNNVSTPTFGLTGNVTITAVINPDDWTSGVEHSIFAKTSGNDGFEFVIQTTGELAVKIGDGAAITTYVSTAATGLANATEHTVKAIYVDGGAGTVDFQVDGGALGAQVPTTKTLTNAATNALIGVSVIGYLKSVTLTNGAATTYADPDFTNRVAIIEPFATFADPAGNTWTINRAATDKPSTVVDQPMLLFDGIDDYVEIADHADLDFDATADMTLMAVARVTNRVVAAQQTLVGKGSVDVNPAFHIYTGSGDANMTYRTREGGASSIDTILIPANITMFTAAMVRDVSAPTLTAFMNGVSSGSPSATAVADLSNAFDIRVGAAAAGAYWSGQIMAAALWRRPLTPAEAAQASEDLVGVPFLDPVGFQTVTEGDTLTINITTTGDDPVITIAGNPDFVTIVDNGDGTATITISPGYDDIGLYEGIQIIVIGSEGVDTETISIRILAASENRMGFVGAIRKPPRSSR